MATKKQKREAARIKHERFMAEIQQSGLEALRQSRKERKRKNLEAWQKQHDEKHSWKKRVKECPHCEIIVRAANKAPDEQVAS